MSGPADFSKSLVGLRQYYVAVGTQEAKLTTLVELLHALQANTDVAVAVCCSSRDSLDEVVAALVSNCRASLAVLHADQSVAEAEAQVQHVKQHLQQQHRQDGEPQQQHQGVTAGALEPPQPPLHQQQPVAPASLVLVTTDVPVRVVSKELLPIGLPLLIQYDIPPSKEALTRRIAAVFGGSKERRRAAKRAPPVLVDFVVAGELPAFRARERFTAAPVLEMPVHVPDIFAAAPSGAP